MLCHVFSLFLSLFSSFQHTFYAAPGPCINPTFPKPPPLPSFGPSVGTGWHRGWRVPKEGGLPGFPPFCCGIQECQPAVCFLQSGEIRNEMIFPMQQPPKMNLSIVAPAGAPQGPRLHPNLHTHRKKVGISESKPIFCGRKLGLLKC